MRVNYEKITVKGYKKGKCVVCGKWCQRIERFSQTLSPFNKDKDGFPKTVDEIYKELGQRVKEWQKGALYHVKCTRKFRNVETDKMIAENEVAKGA